MMNQQKDMSLSNSTTKIVNFDHMKELQECMDSYKIGHGVCSFDTIAFVIAFYERTCNICLVVTKSSTHTYQLYSYKQHSGCNSCVSFGHDGSTGLLHMKKCNFLHSGFTMETTANGGRKLKKRRKGQFQQSYILASSNS